eukprot:7899107-Ditylum_brightwellii.AAC.1
MTKDPSGLGRWVSILFTRSNGIMIRVVVAYQVCQGSVGDNQENKAFKQQVRILTYKKVPNPNPRKQWCMDLEEKLCLWRCQGPTLLICDANSDLLDSNLARMLSNTVLYDLSAIRHGINSPETYICGITCLDYTFASIDLVEPLLAFQWLWYHLIDLADHRGIILNFNTLHMFRGEIHKLKDNIPNKVSTKMYEQSIKYQPKSDTMH